MELEELNKWIAGIDGKVTMENVRYIKDWSSEWIRQTMRQEHNDQVIKEQEERLALMKQQYANGEKLQRPRWDEGHYISTQQAESIHNKLTRGSIDARITKESDKQSK